MNLNYTPQISICTKCKKEFAWIGNGVPNMCGDCDLTIPSLSDKLKRKEAGELKSVIDLYQNKLKKTK